MNNEPEFLDLQLISPKTNGRWTEQELLEIAKLSMSNSILCLADSYEKRFLSGKVEYGTMLWYDANSNLVKTLAKAAERSETIYVLYNDSPASKQLIDACNPEIERKELVIVAAARGMQKILEYKAINSLGICPFCFPDGFTWNNRAYPVLYETDHWGVFYNYNPYKGAKSHIILVPKRHIRSSFDLTDVESSELRESIKKAIELNYMKEWVVIMREHFPHGNPLATGQSVIHFHVHLLQTRPGEVINAYFGIPK